MRSLSWTRAGAVALGLVALTLGANSAVAKPVLPRSRALRLFSLPVHVMNVNRVVCPITSNGQVCVDSTQSPVLEGAFWPKGTPDSYVFNSGLQLAGIIDPLAGFTWAGDTVGVFFMDPRGDQLEGDGVSQIFSSLDQADAANWPNSAVLRDPNVYNAALLGRNKASQEDLWVRAWDGNPALLAGRTHPMGIMVEERGLAWTYPTGNEDIVYFVYTFYNITASDCAAYNNPTIDPAVRDSVCDVGKAFQTVNSQRFGVTFPAAGYAITDLFAAFFEDCDVGEASHNYSTANLVFNMGLCYKSDFLEPNWAFPKDVFAAPLAVAPGFTGTKYLSSPRDSTGKQLGLTLFSNTLNSATGYPDPVGVKQMFRYIHGTSDPAAGDNPCTFQGQQLQRHLCFLAQTAQDTRFFMSSGPFTLKAGEAQTIVVAYLFAAPTPDVLPFVGKDLAPGIPPSDTGLARITNPDTIRTVDRSAGWVSHADKNGDGKIEQGEVTTVPRSLLDKAIVAQGVFDNKFLLPFAPEPPNFFLIPGDNQVTVVWQPTITEQIGDPFYSVANNPLDTLFYDPNFRQYDVEGYRVYRGRTSGDLQLIAQFDYAGTSIIDYTGTFDYGNQCAPELGVDAKPGCPVVFDTVFPVPQNPAAAVSHGLVGDVVQVAVPPKPAGRVKLADGSVLIVKADTAVTGGASGFPKLSDTGVSFAFLDKGVRNSFTYFYSVTAFDVNSFKSGPTSLESPKITKQITPRAPSGQETAGQLSPPVLVGVNGPLPTINAPTLDATTGEFTGPFPPTDGVTAGLVVFLPQLLLSGSVTLTIDSVVPGSALIGPIRTLYYITAQGAGAPSKVVVPDTTDAFDVTTSGSGSFPATAINTAKSARFGGDSTYSLFGSATVTVPGTWRTTSWGRASINGDPANSDFNGPRWWSGSANENTANPNGKLCSPASGGCIQADLSLNAGSLPGVDSIFHVQSYSTVPNVPQRNLEAIGSTVYRAADFRLKWGSNGAVDSVFDITHQVPVPFRRNMRASWGFLNDSSFVVDTTPQSDTPDKNNGLLTWTDIYCIDPVPAYLGTCNKTAHPAFLMDHARPSPIAITSSTFGTPPTTATGSGFILYLNGHFFLMKLTGAAVPAAGTVWNVRFYAGNIVGTPGTYTFHAADVRPPAVPGLKVQVAYQGSTANFATTNDSVLATVHTVPDPYYVTNALELTANSKVLKFVHLPAQCIIRIYSTSGILVQVLTHNDPTGGGEATWNLRNRNNQFVASGVYFYHIEAPDGHTKIGRFTVITFAP